MDAIVVKPPLLRVRRPRVLRDVSFTVPKGSMRFLLGASGSGKSVLLKLIMGLLPPDGGTIEVNGQRVDNLRERDLLRMRAGIGMSFQENALFDSLTVNENVGYRLYEDRPATGRSGGVWTKS
jgi:phospholipid/cholesterol/gamma-HCH transport system ATP-binding protein